MKRLMFNHSKQLSRGAIVLGLFLGLALVQKSSAQSSLTTGNVSVGVLKTFDSEKITIDATAGGVGFTASKINPTANCAPNNCKARLAVCTLETAQIRALTSGTVTSTTGLVIDYGLTFYVWGYDDIAAFKAIRTGGSSGVLNCQYSRFP